MKKQILAFLLLNALFLAFGFDLKQKNPEELFLSDESFQELKKVESEFGRDDLTFVAGLNDQSATILQNQVEKIEGEYVSLDLMLPHHALFKLPLLDDEQKFNFFQELSSIDSKLRFAGMNFTNAHLAGMSLRIQKILFPAIFGIMFFSLLLLFRNLPTTLYLFLTSFVGVSVGLATVKFFFGFSTILTSLTPLISFILTLATQVHTIFGLQVYKTKKDFFHYKLAPLLIMMGTTVIGFLGLILSDLESIRQFGAATSVTLIIAWSLNLLFLTSFNLDFKIPGNILRGKIKRPGFNPRLGLLIPVLLLGLGLVSLKRMPVLVEALFFFPKDHVIRVGHDQIAHDLGGTPQIDLVIERKDSGELSFENLQAISTYEKSLKTKIGKIKLLTLNDLVESANAIYAKNKILPAERNAYLALKSQVPQMLRSSLQSDHAYKISLLSEALTTEERSKLTIILKEEITKIPSGFQVKMSGLNHLLLESQSTLVSTLIKSLLSSFFLIALIFAFFSRNLKEVLLFSLISLSAIFGGLFFMELFGFSLNVASIMTLSISIGLVDDSTIHLIYAEKHLESEDVIRRSCLIPMMLSHFVLFISFCILGFEPFVLIREFALGLVIMLSMGLLLDLFVLPMLTAKSHDP